MTAAEFTSLLTNENANGYSGQDLENVLKQFPYCQPLRFLMLKKYYETRHPQKEEKLKLAATYATDRSYLFHLLADQPLDETEAESVKDTDIIDITSESSILPEELIAGSGDPVGNLPEVVESEEEVPGEQPFDLTSETVGDEELSGEGPKLEGDIEIAIETVEAGALEIDGLGLDAEAIEELLDGSEPGSEINIDKDGSLDLSGILSSETVKSDKKEKTREEKKNKKKKKRIKNKAPKIKVHKKAVEPSQTMTFVDWLSSLSSKSDVAPVEKKRKKAKKPKSKTKKSAGSKSKKNKKAAQAVKITDLSLTDHNDNVSETLANILALQGNKAKAVAMYEQLILKFPEKSTYFAVKIEKLKS